MPDSQFTSSLSSPQPLDLKDIAREALAVSIECSAHLPKLTPDESDLVLRVRRTREQGFLPSLVEIDMLLVIVDWLTQGRPHV